MNSESESEYKARIERETGEKAKKRIKSTKADDAVKRGTPKPDAQSKAEFDPAQEVISHTTADATVKLDAAGTYVEKVESSEAAKFKRKKKRRSGLLGYIIGHTEEVVEEEGFSNASQAHAKNRKWAVGGVIVLAMGAIAAFLLLKLKKPAEGTVQPNSDAITNTTKPHASRR